MTIIAQDTALVIAFIGIFLFGYYLMFRVDRFLSAEGFTDGPAVVSAKHTILVYGETELAEALVDYLREKGVTYLVTNRPDIPENASFLAIAAVSKNDTDNLLLCSQAKKLWPGVILFAVCNDLTYKNLFDFTGVNQIFTGSYETSVLLESLKGWVDYHA